jgi:hypothetical protein
MVGMTNAVKSSVRVQEKCEVRGPSACQNHEQATGLANKSCELRHFGHRLTFHQLDFYSPSPHVFQRHEII